MNTLKVLILMGVLVGFAQVLAAEETYVITASAAKVRKTKSFQKDSKILGEIMRGETVEVLDPTRVKTDHSGSWLKVRYKGHIAWINYFLLKPADESAAVKHTRTASAPAADAASDAPETRPRRRVQKPKAAPPVETHVEETEEPTPVAPPVKTVRTRKPVVVHTEVTSPVATPTLPPVETAKTDLPARQKNTDSAGDEVIHEAPPVKGFAGAKTVLASGCNENIVKNLEKYDPLDYKNIYQWAVGQPMMKKAFYENFKGCNENPLATASTVVHETTHLKTSAFYENYPLINGHSTEKANCGEKASSMIKPSVLVSQFAGDKSEAHLVRSYLRPGDADSSKSFCSLMDELNAYTHQLHAVMLLKNHLRWGEPGSTTSEREGLLAMLSYIRAYADFAQKSSDKRTWNYLKGELNGTLKSLWNQGTFVLHESCGTQFSDDKFYYTRLCNGQQMGAITELTGTNLSSICAPKANCIGSGGNGASARVADDGADAER